MKAALLFSKTNPSPLECITFRNFMTEIAVCNLNRPGIWSFITVDDIQEQKTEVINGEHQLETEDPKTKITLQITFPEANWKTILKYIKVTRKTLTKQPDISNKLMLAKDGTAVDQNVNPAKTFYANTYSES